MGDCGLPDLPGPKPVLARPAPAEGREPSRPSAEKRAARKQNDPPAQEYAPDVPCRRTVAFRPNSRNWSGSDSSIPLALTGARKVYYPGRAFGRALAGCPKSDRRKNLSNLALKRMLSPFRNNSDTNMSQQTACITSPVCNTAAHVFTAKVVGQRRQVL